MFTALFENKDELSAVCNIYSNVLFWSLKNTKTDTDDIANLLLRFLEDIIKFVWIGLSITNKQNLKRCWIHEKWGLVIKIYNAS